MSFLLLSLRVESLEYVNLLDNNFLPFKFKDKIKYKVYLLYKYMTHNKLSLILYIFSFFYLDKHNIIYYVFLLLSPIINPKSLSIYLTYSISIITKQPFLLLLAPYINLQFTLPFQVPFITIYTPFILKSNIPMQQIAGFLILQEFVSLLNHSKELINRHKSYYMISKINRKKICINFFLRNTLIISILYIVFLNKKDVILSFIYLLLFELHYFFNYEVFNRSWLYQDSFSRITFKILIYNGLSLSLLLHQYSLFFNLWYLIWIGVFLWLEKHY